MLDPRIIIRFIPKKVMVQLQDKLVDNLSDISPDPRWRKLVRSFRSDAQFQSAFEKALEKAVQRFAAEHSDQELVDALTQSTRFWDLPSVQKALKTIVNNPSSYLDKERDTLLDSFAEVAPGVEPERVEQAARFFLHCLAEEVINIPQLFPLYQVQLQKASVEQARELVAAVRELQFDQKQTMTALLEAVNQNQLLLAAPNQPATVSGPKIYHNLPRSDYSVFIGRETEKAKVIERLSPKKQGGVITIDGVGGVGKSALALEVAYYFVDNAQSLPENERFEAIIWTSAKQTVLTADGIRARPQVLRNLEDIYTTIAITLDREDILRSRPEEQAILIMDALSERRTLLIVDNLETLDDENLLEFLRELPLTAKAIVTTRHRIDVAYPVRLIGMPEADALALSQNESEQKEVILSLEEAKKLVQRTGGLPLAIVWSVGLMGMGHSTEAVLVRLGSAKSDIIKFSFQSSVETVRDQDAFRVLLALSLFAKDATREALGYVAGFGEDEMSRDDALVVLEKLSLVNKSGNRFSLLPLTKVFANAELEDDKKVKNSLVESWCSYFLLNFNFDNSNRDKEFDKFDLEIPNLFGFVEWCWINDRIDIAVRFLVKNVRLFWARGEWTGFYYHLNLAYSRLITEERYEHEFSILAYEIAAYDYFRDEIGKAKTLLLQALPAFEKINDTNHIIRTCRFLTKIFVIMKDFSQANIYMSKAYQAIKLSELPILNIFRLKRYIAEGELACGNIERATELLEEGINYQETNSTEETSTLCLAYTLLGEIYLRKGNYTEAMLKLERSLEIVRRTQIRHDTAFVLQKFALLKEALNNKEETLKYATEALKLYRQLGVKTNVDETEEIIIRAQAMSK